MNNTQPPPEDLTDIEKILYAHAMNPTAFRVSLSAVFDYEEVAWTAAHGPRSVKSAQYILDTPGLSEVLRKYWAEDPPNLHVRQQCALSPQGQQLLDLAPDGKGDEDDVVVKAAMSNFDLEWWVLSSPELAAAAAAHDAHLATLVDTHRQTMRVTRQEAVAGRAWIEIQISGLPADSDNLAVRLRLTHVPDAPEYWALLVHDAALGLHRTELELPSLTRWIDPLVSTATFSVRDAVAADQTVIADSVRAATLTFKQAWQALARAERDNSLDQGQALIEGVIDGLTN